MKSKRSLLLLYMRKVYWGQGRACIRAPVSWLGWTTRLWLQARTKRGSAGSTGACCGASCGQYGQCIDIVPVGIDRAAASAMNGRISSIAAGPYSNDSVRRPRPNSTLKPGFLIKKDVEKKQNITASSHVIEPIASSSDEAALSDQLEAEQKESPGDNGDEYKLEQKVEELPKPVPCFEAAQAPKLIAVDTTSISLQWQSVGQLPPSEQAKAYAKSQDLEEELPSCDLEYCLQTRLVLHSSD